MAEIMAYDCHIFNISAEENRQEIPTSDAAHNAATFYETGLLHNCLDSSVTSLVSELMDLQSKPAGELHLDDEDERVCAMVLLMMKGSAQAICRTNSSPLIHFQTSPCYVSKRTFFSDVYDCRTKLSPAFKNHKTM